MIKHLKYKIKSLLNFNKRQLGEVQIELAKKNYNKIENIRDAEIKIFSQFGEDGIINFLLHKLGLNEKIKFVEIGTGDYEEANTRFLCESRICEGLLIDKIDDLKFIKKRDFYWKNDLYFYQKMINSKNISSVIKDFGFESNCNLLSLDIDGNDYWVLKNINLETTDMVIVEYNPLFGSNLSITIPEDDNFDRNKNNKLFYGASLRAMIDLLDQKNFFFIGANKACNNGFFINNKYKSNFSDIKINNLKKYTDFTFRELKKNSVKENAISYLVNLIDHCEIYNLKSKKIIKIKEIKETLINDR
jgi:hypothetical protein